MFKLTGDFGEIIFQNQSSSRYITIPAKTSTKLFSKIALLYPDIAANELGLYSFGQIDRNQEVQFMSLNAPKHILSSRKNGCTWSPKGKMTNEITKTTMCPIEYNGEQCPDVFWDSCMETIFEGGNGVRDIFGTPEGKALAQQMISKIYEGLGNSFYEVAEFGGHPLIDEADANDWYTVSEEEWTDFTDQQAACTGYMTLVDLLKEEGLPNMNIPIHVADTNGAQYVGDAWALIDRCLRSSSATFSQILRARNMGKNPIIQVSRGIFDRLEEQLSIRYSTIPDMFYYFLNGQTVKGELMPGVLRYKGFNIVARDSWSIFDDITGTITHRVIVSVPGLFGLAHDTPDLKQFTGMGLRMVQHLDAPWQGKIFMDTTFKIGTAILDKTLMNNASLTLTA